MNLAVKVYTNYLIEEKYIIFSYISQISYANLAETVMIFGYVLIDN